MTATLDRKLTLVILLVSTVALVVACAAFILLDRLTFRSQFERDLTSQASIIGLASRAALDFGDAFAAQEGLESFAAVPTILAAYLYTADGTLLARYPETLEALPLTLAPGLRYGERQLTLVHPIASLSGEDVGTLVVRHSLQAEIYRQRRYLLISGLVLLCALAISFGVALRFRRTVTGPILHLTDTVQQVALAQDYGVRVETREVDELGRLARQFNAMLAEIQQRDTALAQHRAFLEDQVAERTVELRVANADLVEARDRAEAVSRLKTTLLDNLSHEFRTPVSGIIALADILQAEVEPHHTDLVAMIGGSGTRLMETLTMVLDLTQLDAGEYVPTLRLHPLPALVADTVAPFCPRIEAAGLGFGTDVPPISAWVDEYAFRTVVGHLLSNAAKFTPRGEVRVEVATDNEALVVSVRDTGIGIAPAFEPFLFTPFRQGSEGTTRAYEGMGLGLTVAQGMAQAMGSTLTITSEVGAGTCATLRLPDALSPRPNSTPHTAYA